MIPNDSLSSFRLLLSMAHFSQPQVAAKLVRIVQAGLDAAGASSADESAARAADLEKVIDELTGEVNRLQLEVGELTGALDEKTAEITKLKAKKPRKRRTAKKAEPANDDQS